MASKIKYFNIKADMPDRVEASRRLMEILRTSKGKEKVIKIIHGYGSSGVGGIIKQTVHKLLRSELNSKKIRAYIPGEAIYSLMGFDDVIHRFDHLIKHDSDYKKGNDGITYIIF